MIAKTQVFGSRSALSRSSAQPRQPRQSSRIFAMAPSLDTIKAARNEIRAIIDKTHCNVSASESWIRVANRSTVWPAPGHAARTARHQGNAV
jgi:hypothetical protein